jgi:hypothetical protein
LLLEEYGVIFEYLPEKKNVVADALSRLDIDSLKIQEEEVRIIKQQHHQYQIDNPNAYYLDLQRTSKSQ